MKLPSLKMAYCSWLALLIITTAYSFITGTYQAEMSEAVNKAGALPEGMSHEQMLFGFIAISLSVGIVLIIISAFLTWQASKNKRWAVWALSAFALWQAFDSIYSNIQIAEMYDKNINPTDWLLSIVCSLIWLYIIFAAHKFHSRQKIEPHTP